MLICRFTQWPTAEEQTALLEQMLALGLRRPITSAVIDLTAVDDLPSPDVLAESLARATGKNAVFTRSACVVRTADQERFAATLKTMAARPHDVAVFAAEDAALKWLGIDVRRFKR